MHVAPYNIGTCWGFPNIPIQYLRVLALLGSKTFHAKLLEFSHLRYSLYLEIWSEWYKAVATVLRLPKQFIFPDLLDLVLNSFFVVIFSIINISFTQETETTFLTFFWLLRSICTLWRYVICNCLFKTLLVLKTIVPILLFVFFKTKRWFVQVIQYRLTTSHYHFLLGKYWLENVA